MKLDAEALRHCLLSGAIPVEFAIEWADRRVDERDKPHASLLEATMAVQQSPEEVAAFLARVPGEIESHEALVHRKFAWMHEALTADPGRCRTLFAVLLGMAMTGDLDGFPERGDIYSIDEAFELSAPGGSGDRAEAERQVGEFLSRFAEVGLRE